MSQDQQKEWADWRRKIEENQKTQGDKLDSISSQMREVTLSLKPPEKAPPEKVNDADVSKKGSTFKEFVHEHVPNCPNCQKVLQDEGFVKKPKEESKPKKDKWSVSDV